MIMVESLNFTEKFANYTFFQVGKVFWAQTPQRPHVNCQDNLLDIIIMIILL